MGASEEGIPFRLETSIEEDRISEVGWREWHSDAVGY
jgi:hypothetical protein